MVRFGRIHWSFLDQFGRGLFELRKKFVGSYVFSIALPDTEVCSVIGLGYCRRHIIKIIFLPPL